MQRALWILLLVVVTADFVLLLQRRDLLVSVHALRAQAEASTSKERFVAEEEALVGSLRVVPAAFPLAHTRGAGDDTLQIILLSSVNDCTNAVEDEIAKLNSIQEKRPRKLGAITGFYVDANRSLLAAQFIGHLNPTPSFPVHIQNVLSGFPEASTPLVLVVREHDRTIVDAHKPVPDNLIKRDAFYARLEILIGIS